MATRLFIKGFSLGDWMTNCYVVHRAKPAPGAACWIVDAGFSPDPLIEYVKEHKLAPEQVVLTHAHVDHIAGLHAMRGAWPEIPILIHRAEEEFLIEPALNLSIALDEQFIAPPATRLLEHGDIMKLDGVPFHVRLTPGHSPGGISLYQPDDGVVLVGDALFAGSVGRTDFPTSDPAALMAGIRSQLLSLPDPTRVLPGHGPETTIGQERATNPYLGR